MVIESKLSERDFINATFVLLYSKRYIKITIAVFVLIFLVNIAGLIFNPVSSSYWQLFVLVGVLFVRPIIIYINVKRSFASNKRSGELVIYTFGNDYLSIKGESFSTELSWDKIYKVTQSKNWVFIWQNKGFANILSKQDIWEEQIDQLKVILQHHKVKNTL
ncbi:MAG TPA: YcxB family protein [Ferruginibacter sp.]|jgi:hypothetical protein|nr:YcxB family protein [Ferruginibacter sp.]